MPEKRRFPLTVDILERQDINETTADGVNMRGHRIIKTGESQETVEVEVDWEKIVRTYGARACRSNRGKAQFGAGLVKVRRIKR